MPEVLLVDDDPVLLEVMARAFARRGFQSHLALSAQAALDCARDQPQLSHAVVDLRLGEGNGLQLIAPLKALCPTICLVVLTGYASIATAVEAIKLGAQHYLTKPADLDDLLAAFGDAGREPVAPVATPTSLERAEWEYIQKTLLECGGNVSDAARRLGLHRRTLQRKLQKRPSGMT